MSLLSAFEGTNFLTRLYVGPRARKMFCNRNISLQFVARLPGTMGETLLALFLRDPEAGTHETSIFFCDHGRNEMLRFFSWGHEGFEAACSLYADLQEELEYESLMLFALDLRVLQEKNQRRM